jgi:hypothetical protein
MKIGAITGSLGALSFDELLGTAAELGMSGRSSSSGAGRSAPHVPICELVGGFGAAHCIPGTRRYVEQLE